MRRADRVELIGKPAGPVALNVAGAFWESSAGVRTSYWLLTLTTVGLLVVCGLGGAGGL